MRVDLKYGTFYSYKKEEKPSYFLKSRRKLIVPGVYINLDDVVVDGYLVITFSEFDANNSSSLLDRDNWKDVEFVED